MPSGGPQAARDAPHGHWLHKKRDCGREVSQAKGIWTEIDAVYQGFLALLPASERDRWQPEPSARA
jgi:hypothetical protein